MIHFPILRWGEPYKSLEVDKVYHHATGEQMAEVSQANAGIIARDMRHAERARELLESAARSLDPQKARPTVKAKLWALLGRARAELGDTVGTDEAFRKAVIWDRRVKLAPSTFIR